MLGFYNLFKPVREKLVGVLDVCASLGRSGYHVEMLVLIQEDQRLSSQAFQMALPSPTSQGKNQQRQDQLIQMSSFPKYFPQLPPTLKAQKNKPSSCLRSRRAGGHFLS